ncbi:putative lipoprotein [Myxococcus hansupus]|uniref:Putative lipoprotein n=1 Tax=Pseudomyxococcus hansupus TaxID=1297742 RepID=A0A0H4XA56_9BACT|nr:putative lipoprotein [Myxococcus hansupus]
MWVLVVLSCNTVEVPGDAEACAGLQCTAGTCFSNAGQPMCRCGPWEAAAELTCSVATFRQPDDHGGSPDSATVLTLPMSPREARISEGTRVEMWDRDLFAVTVPERGLYAFSCTRLTLAECRVRLLDAEGRSRHVLAASEGARESWFATLTEGTWYFEVSGGASAGRYNYQLVSLGTDDHGDTFEEATVLEEGSRGPFSVRLSHIFDQDMFVFRSQVGHGYRFICEAPPGPGLWMELGFDDFAFVDQASGATGAPLALSLGATSVHTWRVSIVADSGPFPVEARCRFEDLGRDEHGDTLETATPVTAGVPVGLTLQSRDDVDVFSFAGEAGHVYSVRTDGAGPWSAQVVDGTGANVASSTTDRLRARVGTAGTHYLRIQGGPDWEHTFSLTLVDAGVDDHGDSPQTATVITPGTTVTGRFETPADTDAIAFLAEPGGIYLATYAPSERLSFNPRGVAGSLTLGEGRHLFGGWEAGPVTMMFQPRNDAEGFSLHLEQVAVDDHADHSAEAQQVRLPVDISGVVQTAIDTDVFSVRLEEGRRYRLGLDTGPLAVTLVAPGGGLSRPVSGVLVPVFTGPHLMMLTGASGLAQVPWRVTLQAE